MSALFSPLRLGSLTLKNRIIIAPMCQYSAVNGNATDWHMMHLGGLALSGAGMLILEATAVEAIGRISPGDLGLWSDENETALARVLTALRQHSQMPIAIQLGHAGRKASSQAPWDGGQLIALDQGGWDIAAPSALPHAVGERAPQALDDVGLKRVKQAFIDAAMRAQRLGIDAIELHAAHGYLLHQFLSPISNQRTDSYGGSVENRLRFPLEVFEAVRAAVARKNMTVGVRISATDWVEGGLDMEQSKQFVLALQEHGCDFVHVSSGGVSPAQKIPVGPGYQVHLAEEIKRHCNLPVIAVGLITDPHQAEDIITAGQADAIGIARGILYDPHWPWHAAAALGATVDAPRQYWRSQPRELKNLFGNISIGQR